MIECRITVRVGEADFDPGHELAAVGPHGAVASFIGHVRADASTDTSTDTSTEADAAAGVATLYLDHHPTMTAKALHGLATRAATRWPLAALTLIHRVGALGAGQRIVLVATASPHREAALAACAFLIDRLKTDVPLWKRETMADGHSRWVEPREDDEARAAQWAGDGATCK